MSKNLGQAGGWSSRFRNRTVVGVSVIAVSAFGGAAPAAANIVQLKLGDGSVGLAPGIALASLDASPIPVPDRSANDAAGPLPILRAASALEREFVDEAADTALPVRDDRASLAPDADAVPPEVVAGAPAAAVPEPLTRAAPPAEAESVPVPSAPASPLPESFTSQISIAADPTPVPVSQPAASATEAAAMAAVAAADPDQATAVPDPAPSAPGDVTLPAPAATTVRIAAGDPVPPATPPSTAGDPPGDGEAASAPTPLPFEQVAAADTAPEPVPPAAAPPSAPPVENVRTVIQHGDNTPRPQAPPPVTTNDVTLNLIHLLVQQKIISAKQADALFQQAQQQAGAAPAPRARTEAATAPASPPTVGSAAPQAAPAAPAPSIRVTYIPEAIKQEIKDETKKELIAEGSLPPPPASVLPDWLRRIKFDGDFRVRYERVLYDGGNSNLFVNYNALAASATPFDISSNQLSFPPLLDTTEDRSMVRVRARFGLVDTVSNDVTVAFRLSTGTDGNPVSPNQTLGQSFNKFDVVFDRAYLDYHPLSWAQFRVGRFPDPWFATDLMWYSDLNFDGAALELGGEITPTIRPFLTVGAFPVQNTALDFPTYDDQKQGSRDKWLYGAQIGASWLIEKQFLVKLGAAYYDYVNLEGKTSSPCLAYLVSIACDTDDSRPGFLQTGNTLYGIRDIVLPSSTTTPSAFQYFGLASPFRDIDATGRIDWAMSDPIHVILDGEFAMNLAFNKSRIAAKDPVNNLDGNSKFAGGNIAYMAKLTLGNPEIKHLGDWNVSAAYKYLESDSLVDAFTDPDFHFGGTNAKGYIVGTNLGIARDVWLTARYLSATEISGPPYGVDVVQVDLNARF